MGPTVSSIPGDAISAQGPDYQGSSTDINFEMILDETTSRFHACVGVSYMPFLSLYSKYSSLAGEFIKVGCDICKFQYLMESPIRMKSSFVMLCDTLFDMLHILVNFCKAWRSNQ